MERPFIFGPDLYRFPETLNNRPDIGSARDRCGHPSPWSKSWTKEPANLGHDASLGKEETILPCDLAGFPWFTAQPLDLFRTDDQVDPGLPRLGGDVSLAKNRNPHRFSCPVGEKNRFIDTVLRLRHINILEIDGEVNTL
jgi:hypothetical protein